MLGHASLADAHDTHKDQDQQHSRRQHNNKQGSSRERDHTHSVKHHEPSKHHRSSQPGQELLGGAVDGSHSGHITGGVGISASKRDRRERDKDSRERQLAEPLASGSHHREHKSQQPRSSKHHEQGKESDKKPNNGEYSDSHLKHVKHMSFAAVKPLIQELLDSGKIDREQYKVVGQVATHSLYESIRQGQLSEHVLVPGVSDVIVRDAVFEALQSTGWQGNNDDF